MAEHENFRYKCEACGRDISDGDGYLIASVNGAYRARDELAAWEAGRQLDGEGLPGTTLDEVMAGPKDERWTPLHMACDDPAREDVTYAVSVEEARTGLQLLKWTLHLIEKDWFQYTNWEELVREAIPDYAGPGS